VKGRVTFGAQPAGDDLLFHGRHGGLHRSEVLVTAVRSGQLRKLDLEGFARLENLGQPAPALEELGQ